MQLKKELNKKVGSGLAWFLVIIAVGSFMLSTNLAKKKTQKVFASTSDMSYSSQANAKIPTDIGIPASQISPGYRRALTKYASRRLEVNDACQITPSHVTFRNGTSIMLDNISAKNHTLLLDEPIYLLDHKYKIVNLFGVIFPKTIIVGCDSSQFAATITIQK